MSYQAGTAFVQVVPSFQGFVDECNKIAEQAAQSSGRIFSDTWSRIVGQGTSNANVGPSDADSAEKGSSAGGKFADGFKAKVEAALKSLPNAAIGADASPAERKIAEIRTELETLSSQRVGVDISDADAIAKVEALKLELDELAAKSPTISVRVDAAGAAAELGAIDAGAGNAGGSLRKLASDAADSAGGMNLMIPAIAALGAALVPLAGLAAGALATLPAIIAGAASGLAALKIGFSGIGGAISAFDKQQSSQAVGGGSGSSTSAISNAASIRNSANAVISAQEAVSNAQTSAANAVHQAQEQLTSSEQALASAERNEASAQEALIAARQQAQRQLDDYVNQLADAALSQRQAQLDLTQAQQNLAQVNSTPGATSFQKAEAQLAFDQAVQRLKDLQTQNKQLQQDASAAAAAGVDGNQQVVAATQQVADAQQSVANAQQSNQDAATNLAQAQVSSVQQVADAQRALQQALDNQADSLAQVQAGSGGAATATDAFAKAMAGLSPAGRTFVDFVTGTLLPMYNDFKAKVQAALLPGITTALVDLLPVFQAIEPFILQAATGIGQLAQSFAEFLSSPTGLSEANTIFSAGAGFMQQMGQAALILFQAFGSIGAQATPIVQALGDGILHLVEAFAKWAENGGFQKFLEWLRENGPSIVANISSFVKNVAALVIAVAPFGEFLIKAVKDIAEFVTWLLKAGPVAHAFAVVAGVIGAAIYLLGASVGFLIGALVVDIIDMVGTFGKAWAEIKGAAVEAWQWLDGNVFQPLGNFFTNTVPHFIDDAVGFFKDLPGRISGALSSVFGTITGAFGDVGGWVNDHVIQPVVHFFEGLPDNLKDGLSKIGDAIENAFKAAFNFVAKAWNDTVGSLSFTIPGWVPVLGGDTFGVPKIPTFHDGGVVPGPTGSETLALVQAGETVLTRGQSAQLFGAAASQGSGNLSINQTITAFDPRTAATAAAQQAAWAAKTRGF